MSRLLVILVLLFSFVFLAGSACAGLVFTEIKFGDSSHLDKAKIVEILSKESMVFFADGQTQLGSLFGQEHRHYVNFHEMPKSMLDAVVAAEDDRFYTHFGVDPISTIRAAFRNIILGRHEGASTITQQTVKNLYGRSKVNLLVKAREALNALKLERRYSKQEILEFYLNQFHVSGNGRGVGIAAKYYFDKDVSDLSLTEVAFIAGSVKAPDRYTPFTKRSIKGQETARAAAKVRKDYVLKRMRDLKFIDEPTYQKARAEEVPFRQGRFQFNEIAAIDIVQRQLNRKEILNAVGVESVDELGTLGLRITSTFDKNVQTASQYGVRQNLSRLEMILTGFEKEQQKNFVNIQLLEKFGFYVGQVRGVEGPAGKETVKLGFGVPECVVPANGLDRVATYLDRALGRGVAKTRAQFVKNLKPGEYLLASIRDVDAATKAATCDIERRPRIQGGLIAIDKGKIAAMVGGFQPHEYNRAVFARRQPGSTFKTLTYYPALQMGWSSLDKILNTRMVHQWQDQFYFPRPDHPPETLETTLAGAGAKSENLSSVWLLRHLTDRLSYEQFLDLLSALGFYSPSDTPEAVLAKVQRKFNVRFLEEHYRGQALQTAQNELIDDIALISQPSLRAFVRMMNYGSKHESETALAGTTGDDFSPAEKLARVHILRNNYLRWQRVLTDANRGFEALREVVDSGRTPPEELKAILPRFKILADGSALAYVSEDVFDIGAVSPLIPSVAYRSLGTEELLVQLDANRKLLDKDELRLDGILPVSLLKTLEQMMDERVRQVQGGSLLEKLYGHDDFRYSIGMYYVHRMCKEMGIESEIQWVPSYPLGANVVTLAELAMAYQTVLTGKTWRYFSQGADNQVLAIERIEDINGQLLWEASPKVYQLIDEIYSGEMLGILRGTVTHGTAYAAHNAIVLEANSGEAKAPLQAARIRVPTFGKTGTTNEYVNATYVGFLPYPESAGVSQLDAENAYTIAAYVGYDSNEPMRKGGFRVAGGTGALPAWIETARALIREKGYAEKLGWKALVDRKVQEIPFDYGSGASTVRVGLHGSAVVENNGPADADDDADANTYNDYAVNRKGVVGTAVRGVVEKGVFEPKRKVSFFNPRSPSNGGAVDSENTEKSVREQKQK
jgi:penicillin-binding protein 1A